MRGRCLSVFAIRFALCREIALSLCKAKPESRPLLPIGASYELAPILAKVRIDE